MQTDILRRKYLDFFAQKGHRIIPSSPLIPYEDPSLLFTCAGMNQFKKEFLGQVTGFNRAATCQRCLRTDDLDKVGQTPFHHTFFEMLGNFSFGSYFKEEAITWAWEFLTEELKLNPGILLASVYNEDEEAFEIWKEKTGLPEEKIVRLGAKDNFWPANAIENGPNGPCGPCSEIFYDYGKETGCAKPDCKPGCGCPRFIEIWNLVFTQFNRKEQGVLEALPNKNIDTGMGLERMASILQGVRSNFETDIFLPIIKEIKSALNLKGQDPAINPSTPRSKGQCINIIADHIRAIVFAIYDGVTPSNEQRGYVVRKLIRVCALKAEQLQNREAFLYKLVSAVSRTFQNTYPQLSGKAQYISDIIQKEEMMFLAILNEAPKILKKEFSSARSKARGAETAFKLHDTYGIPLEITKPWADQNGLTINEEEFNRCLNAQRDRSKKSSKIQESVFTEDIPGVKTKNTIFRGYSCKDTRESKIVEIISNGWPREETNEGEGCVLILDETPFYAQSGGQIGDKGKIFKGNNIFEVYETKKHGNAHLHAGKMLSGKLKTADRVTAQIDVEFRQAICRAHSATHILQSVLRGILGGSVEQSGSLVEADRLRFDFTHTGKIDAQTIQRIEEQVENEVLSGHSITVSEKGLEEAKKEGALAFFAEKYASRVRIVNIGGYSKELCGGTHLSSSSAIGLFKIISESSISKGTRRIEAVTGRLAWDKISRSQRLINKISNALKADEESLYEIVLEKIKMAERLEKENESLRINGLKGAIDELIRQSTAVNQTKVITYKYNDSDMNTLRKITDMIKSRLSSYAVCLAAAEADKAWLLIALSNDLVGKNHSAKEIVKEIAPLISGGGGGRDNIAQAGGSNIQAINTALDKFRELMRSKL